MWNKSRLYVLSFGCDAFVKVIDKRLELPLLTPWVPLTSTRTHPKFYRLLLLSNKFRSILFAFPVYATYHAKNKVTLENRNTNTRDVDVVLKSVCPARSPREMCCYHNQIEILPGTYHFEGYTLYSRNYIWRICRQDEDHFTCLLIEKKLLALSHKSLIILIRTFSR